MRLRLLTLATSLAAAGLVTVGSLAPSSPSAAGPLPIVGAPAPGASNFTPLNRRLLDTRVGTVLKARSAVVVPVVVTDVAPNASFVTLNVTATDTAGSGFLSVFPNRSTGLPSPIATSVLNVDGAGQTRANQTTVEVGTDGRVLVYTDVDTHVIVDLVGFYTPQVSGMATAGRFHPANQQRLLDTRRTGTKPGVGATTDVAVAGRGGVPSGVSAVVVNLTGAAADQPTFIAAYPKGTAWPGTSNVNIDRAGGTAANLVTVPVSADGSITVFTQNSVHLIVDVVGWFTGSAAPSSADGLFVGAARRILDSRSGARPAAGSRRTLTLGDASSAQSILVNAVVTNSAAPGFVSAFPNGEPWPGTSTLNTSVGQTIANAAVVANVDGVALFTDPSAHLITDMVGYYVDGYATTDVDLQLLSLNDYHGYLQSPSGTDADLGAFETVPVTTPATPKTLVGGAEYLAPLLSARRAGADRSLTVAAGDLIGGTPFLSGLFRDEPSVESLEAMGLDVSGVGNHEFDEGVTELLRMQNGGCHPVDGCFFPSDPYDGARFPWLAANVVNTATGKTVLPPTWVKSVSGIKVGFIGMTLESTPELVSQAGIVGHTFQDEIVAGNAAAAALKAAGVKAMVVLIHEGGLQTGDYNGCTGVSGPIAAIAAGLSPDIDMIVSGHTHQPYVCTINDPDGAARKVTSASSFGRVVTDSTLRLSRTTGDVDRESVTSLNRLVVRTVTKDVHQTAIISKWNTKAAPTANKVVGSIAVDLARAPNRDAESALGNLIADAQLAATVGNGAQIALMNPGGIRADLKRTDIAGGEAVGEITFGESFTVQPFGNLLVTINMTGAQIEQVLEQQAIATRSRPVLILGVSKGFEFSYNLTGAFGDRIDPASIKLDGVVIAPVTTYKVTVNNFLADGGDGFTVFAAGTNRVGGGDDLEAFNRYLTANSPVASPGTTRINEIVPA
jgi:2',3'-cyclic-nucleotide 2'-phosphodiesterase (5'-nucleotidase family)